MMTSKEWVIHKRLDDANPMPKMRTHRGDARSTSSLALYFWVLKNYMKRPIYVENPPIIRFRKELNYE